MTLDEKKITAYNLSVKIRQLSMAYQQLEAQIAAEEAATNGEAIIPRTEVSDATV